MQKALHVNTAISILGYCGKLKSNGFKNFFFSGARANNSKQYI